MTIRDNIEARLKEREVKNLEEAEKNKKICELRGQQLDTVISQIEKDLEGMEFTREEGLFTVTYPLGRASKVQVYVRVGGEMVFWKPSDESQEMECWEIRVKLSKGASNLPEVVCSPGGFSKTLEDFLVKML